MNKAKPKRITFQKRVWCKIRCWQQINDVANSALAECLDVGERTLKTYDKDASNITLSQIDQFLYMNDMTIHDLFNV